MEEYFIYYGGAGLSFLCIILLIIDHIRLSGMIKKYKLLIKGLGKTKVEDLMISYSDELDKIKNILQGNIENRILKLEGKMPTCLRNVGLVSYNAFENVGNKMSFSFAALDDRKNGVIFTGIYTRETSYMYVKEIIDGRPNKELSTEEKDALEKAVSNIK